MIHTPKKIPHKKKNEKKRKMSWTTRGERPEPNLYGYRKPGETLSVSSTRHRFYS
jgi:hypothetical protein